MPFVPVPNAALVELRMLLFGQKVENTLWFFSPTPWDLSLLTQLNNDMTAWWVDEYADCISDNCTLREIACTDMSSPTGPQVVLPPPEPASGTITGPSLPNNVTLTVSFRTSNRGRSFRGRNYIAGLAEASNTANEMDASYIGTVISAYETLLAEGGALTAGTWVVASRFSGIDSEGKPIPREEGITTPITSVTVVDNIIDSQRRRLPGRGK